MTDPVTRTADHHGQPTDLDPRQTVTRILVFCGLTFAISSVGYAIAIARDESSIFLLAAPAVAALITRSVFQRNLRGFGLGRPPVGPTVLAYALPIALSASVFVPAWLLFDQYTTATTDAAPLTQFIGTATVGIAAVSLFALGEELGWRGFLVPELAKITNFTNVALISGAVWAAWHWPLILFAADVADFDKVPTWFGLPVFTVTIMAAGTVMAWLTLRTGSIWPAVVLHGSHNAITQGFFNDYTRTDDNAAYWISEVGIALAVVWIIAAALVWHRIRRTSGDHQTIKRRAQADSTV